MKKPIILSILLMFLSVSIFAQTSQQEVVAQIGERKITLKEFNDRYEKLKEQTTNWPKREDFLKDLIRFEVGVIEAEKRNLQQDPIVQERFKQELYKALLEKELGKKAEGLTVNESEMQAWYKENPQFRMSQIVIELRYNATPEQKAEAEKRANEIYEEVKKSKRPFEELVKLYSDDPLTKQVGGDMGWITRVMVIPQIYDAAVQMKQNEIRGLIRSPSGLHILKLTGRRNYQNADKRQIRIGAFEEKKMKMFNDYFAQLMKKHSIKSNPSLVK